MRLIKRVLDNLLNRGDTIRQAEKTKATMNDKIKAMNQLEEGRFYGIAVLQSILKNMNLNHSIYTIRDYETWKCLDYKCGKRHNYNVSVCQKCGGQVRPPLINSPRTRGGGKGPGHRRYTAGEIREIVDVFRQRK